MVHAGIKCFHVGVFVTHGHRVSIGCSQGSGKALLEALFLLLQQLQNVPLMRLVLVLQTCNKRNVCSSTDTGAQEQATPSAVSESSA